VAEVAERGFPEKEDDSVEREMVHVPETHVKRKLEI